VDESEQKPLIENNREDYILRERKIRDEKCSAACGNLPTSYYERVKEERLGARTRRVDTRPDLRPQPFELIPSVTSDRGYVALHAMSGYGFGQSIILAEELAAFAAQSGCLAAGIADRFSLIGCVEFSRACKRQGVKPLIGATIELAEGGTILLYARSKRGYQALSTLISRCQLDQPRGYPLADWGVLARECRDLVCLTGGSGGPVDRNLIAGRYDQADRILDRLIEIFGSANTYVQIERSWLPWEHKVEPRLVELAERYRVNCVAATPITHPRREQFPAQDAVMCAHTLCRVEEVIGRKPPRHEDQPWVGEFPARALNAERYFKAASEFWELYGDRTEWIENTFLIAERIDEDVLPARTRLPALYENDDATLRQMVEVRAMAIYGADYRKHRRRLSFELDRIANLGFSRHFLVATDFCDWANENDIHYSGRGSVVDSAVAYVLGMSRIDAIRHKLHFDRFLPGDGTKRPDIDIDFESHRRDDIRNYLIQKFGVDHVGQVCAIGAYCTRGIIREIGKAMGLPDEAIGFLAKRLHGSVAPDQILSAIDRKPELRASNISKDRFRWVFRLAKDLMDVPRDIRCHSSGVVISDSPLWETVPVMQSASPCETEEGQQNLRLIQWDKRSAKYYFDKFDILCLRGQDVLSGTERRLRTSHPELDVQRLPVDDPETYRAFRSGELIGIPQSASPAMRQAHVRLRTENLDDASLVQAGIRPGVGGAVKINELIARRRGKPYTFLDPKFEEILGHTYGIIVFQEQVDLLLQTFAGYSGGEAEDIRDAIHKRRREDYGQRIREELIRRVRANGFGQLVAEQVFEYVAGFKGYGFAQGHALAFAEISIRSVYCQQNFPAEYFAALLSAQPAGYYGPCTIVNEARNRGVPILGPDVNRSYTDFRVEDVKSAIDPRVVFPNGGIRVGLSQVSGLSKETIKRIEDAITIHLSKETQVRFRSVFDFSQRVRPNRDELESLILSGAFDSVHPNRRALLWIVPEAMKLAGIPMSNQAELQLGYSEPPIPTEIEDFSVAEKAVYERRILSLDVSHHLMNFERERISSRGGLTTSYAKKVPPGMKGIVVGNPIRLRMPPTPSGKRVVFFDLEDETGLLNVTCFDDVYQRDGHAIVCSPYVTVIGESQDRDGHTAFLAHRVFPYRPILLSDRKVSLPITVADFLVG
jgi:error-prone DNA polymerase